MLKQKKTIKEEIENKTRKWVKKHGLKRINPDLGVVAVWKLGFFEGVEFFKNYLLPEILQRFIEETNVDYKRNLANLPKIDLKSRGWNKCVDAQIKKQVKWLKENLYEEKNN